MSRLHRPYRTPPRRSLSSHAYPYRSPSHSSSSHTVAYVVLLAVVAAFALGGIYIYQRVFGTISKISSAEEVRTLPTPEGSGPPPELLQRPFNVLVIGIDLREDAPNEGVRSDTIIVAHVNPLEKWASMLSIPRDTVVEIPNDACPTQKINAAYACGYNMPDLYSTNGKRIDPRDSGAALVADTVEDYLGITIDYTLQVDFTGFERMVDAVGGITVDVPRALLDPEYPTENYGYMRLYYPAGLQRLSGAEALRYARTRHADNDFGRAQRQQQVIEAGLNELKRQNLLQQIEAAPKLLDALGDSIRTTLPINNIANIQGLANLAQELSGDRIKRLVLQPETNPDGSSTLLSDYNNLRWDPAYVERQVRALQTAPGTESPAEAATAEAVVVIQVQNGTTRRGLAAQVSTDLDVRGFRVAPAADAPTKDLPNTMILDYTGNDTITRELAEILNVDEQYIQRQPDEPAPPNIDIVVRLGDDYQPLIDTAIQN